MSSARPTTETLVAVGLGANLGGADVVVARFRTAVREVAGYLSASNTAVSGIYRSAAVGPVTEQPDFLNAVAVFTAAEARPSGLMRRLLEVERRAGRARDASRPKGPRTLDLDLLFVSSLVVDEPGPPALRLPHPALHARRFVLEPLAEILGEAFVVPGTTQTLLQLLGQPEVAEQRMTRSAASTWLSAAAR